MIATFELRDGQNKLLDSGARNVLYDYKKWKPLSFASAELKHKDECAFCNADGTDPDSPAQ
ncbi:MAG: hypothetical protein ABSA48_09035 [Terracidiphilus sp.]